MGGAGNNTGERDSQGGGKGPAAPSPAPPAQNYTRTDTSFVSPGSSPAPSTQGVTDASPPDMSSRRGQQQAPGVQIIINPSMAESGGMYGDTPSTKDPRRSGPEATEPNIGSHRAPEPEAEAEPMGGEPRSGAETPGDPGSARAGREVGGAGGGASTTVQNPLGVIARKKPTLIG